VESERENVCNWNIWTRKHNIWDQFKGIQPIVGSSAVLIDHSRKIVSRKEGRVRLEDCVVVEMERAEQCYIVV
jgi:hypothetical protein